MRDVPDVLPGPLDVVRLGERVHAERERRRYSLEELAERSGVSKSMLSDVERGAKVPTVLVLARIATGLRTTVGRLLDEERTARVVVLRHSMQRVARDPAGWVRRVMSPVLPDVEFELMRVEIDPGVVDAGTYLPHGRGSREYVAVEQGALQLTIDGTAYTLRTGDSIYYDGDCTHAFANAGRGPCVYYAAMDVSDGIHRGETRGRPH